MKKLSCNQVDTGTLRVNVTNENGEPVNADVSVFNNSESVNPVDELKTDVDGQTDIVELPAPPVELSFEPGIIQPYGVYDILISAPGYYPAAINGTNIFPAYFPFRILCSNRVLWLSISGLTPFMGTFRQKFRKLKSNRFRQVMKSS